VDSERKDSYSLTDMVDTAKRIRSTGYSSTGRKLKRRSNQPKSDRTMLQTVLVVVGVILMIATMAWVTWWLIRDQGPSDPTLRGDSSAIPLVP